ncbi:hypothetical protein [Clostridium sp. B9]|uniref:hypothetical protein n=1 Tax=Clostridium sp. B9 TaxID=3423224 RepID=UPI003D2ED68B
MKFIRMVIIACEILLVILLSLGVVSKVLGYDMSSNKHGDNSIKIDRELEEKLVSSII